MTMPTWLRPVSAVAVVVPALIAAHLYVGAYALVIFGSAVAGGYAAWWRQGWGALDDRAVAWQIGVTVVLLAHGWEQWATRAVPGAASTYPSLFAASPAEVERNWFHAFPLAVTVMALLGAVALQQRSPAGTFLAGTTFTVAMALAVAALAMMFLPDRFGTLAGAYSAAPLLVVSVLAVSRVFRGEPRKAPA